MNQPLLRAEDLGFAYRRQPWIFRHVAFEMHPGTVMTVLGRNGVGKSTLLRTIAGLQAPSEGVVRVGGDDVARLPPAERAQRISYLPQSHQAGYSYTVRDYVVMSRAPYLSAVMGPRPADRARAERTLEELGLGHLADRPVDRISGGERQLVGIARALVQEAPVILLDEPTSALDVGNQITVLRRIRALARSGYGVVMTTHDPDHAFLLGGDAALVGGPEGFRSGPVDTVLTSESLSRAYGADLLVTHNADLHRTTCLTREAIEEEK